MTHQLSKHLHQLSKLLRLWLKRLLLPLLKRLLLPLLKRLHQLQKLLPVNHV